jgi:hypothetical protein
MTTLATSNADNFPLRYNFWTSLADWKDNVCHGCAARVWS